jgi:hypothetical protein
MRLFSALFFCSLFGCTSGIYAQIWRADTAGFGNNFATTAMCGHNNGWAVSRVSYTANSRMIHYKADTSGAYALTTSTFGPGNVQTIYNIVSLNGKLFAANNYGIYRSTDGGVTWPKVGPAYVSPWAIHVQGDTLWVSQSSPGNSVDYSTDEGATFTTLPGNTGKWFEWMQKDGNTVYLAMTTFGNRFFKVSTDGGLNYTDVIAIPATAYIWGLERFNGGVYAASTDGLYQTLNSGGTWTKVFADSVTGIRAVGNTLLVGTNSNGVFRSTNGTSFIAANSGLPMVNGRYRAVRHFAANNSSVLMGLYVTSTGPIPVIYSTRRSNLGIPFVTTDVGSTPVSEASVVIYPNPAFTTAFVEHPKHILSSETIVALRDMTGRVLREERSAFSTRSSLDLRGLPAGIYNVSVSGGSAPTSHHRLAIAH